MSALKYLGARALHLGLPDCIYRQASGVFLYTSDEDLFGPPADRDPLTASDLAQVLGRAMGRAGFAGAVYAPLAVGGHVDHRLVRAAVGALDCPRTLFYEDFPYCVREEVPLPGLADCSSGAAFDSGAGVMVTGAGPTAADAAQLARGSGGPCLGRLTVPLERDNVRAKVRAAASYRSQIGVLFGSPLALAMGIWRQARRSAGGLGYAETLWAARSPD